MNKDIEKVNENAKIKEEENVARNRGEKIVVEYRKPSIFMSLLLILIGVCLATIVLTLLYIFKIKPGLEAPQEPQKHEEIVIDNNEENEEESKVPDLDLSVEGSFVKELSEKIPYDMFFVTNYADSIIDQGKISDNEKLIYTFLLLREEGKYTETSVEGKTDRLDKAYDSNGLITKADKYTVEDVEKKYVSIYGTEAKMPKEDVEFYVYHVDYDETDGCFYGHTFAGGGGMPWISETRLDSADKSEDGKEVYVYEYYVRAGILEDKGIYAYNKNIETKIGTEEAATYYENNAKTNIFNWHVKDEIFDKYKDNGLVKFKSTFKLDTNGNYYWVSTEPVK